jgi:hypothetical protein
VLSQVQIRGPEGIETWPAAPTPAPGLYVAHTQHGFPVVHVRSGLLIGTYGDPETALAAAIELAPLHDWTGPAPSKRTLTPEVQRQVVDIALRWGARKGSRPTSLADLNGGDKP